MRRAGGGAAGDVMSCRIVFPFHSFPLASCYLASDLGTISPWALHTSDRTCRAISSAASRGQGGQQTRRFAVSPPDGAVLLVCTSFLSYPTVFLSLPPLHLSHLNLLPRSGTSPLCSNSTPSFALEPHMFLISPLRHISPAFIKCGILNSLTQRRRSGFYRFTTAPDIFQGAGSRSSKKTHPPTVW
jgi:hypothetical protein